AERAKQAVVDRKEAEELASQVESLTLEIQVKVDPEGHMYGSVSAGDIALLFQKQGLPVEKKYVLVSKPIKVTGVHKISLKLKEGVPVSCSLHIIPEGINAVGLEKVVAPIAPEEGSSSAGEESSPS